MPVFRSGTVVAELSARPGLQRVTVELGDGPERAYVLTELTGPVEVGDPVVVNTTAVELGLGSGGWHVVHWNLARREWRQPGPGHIIKLRYTSLQVDTGAAEELRAEVLVDADDLDGMPVVACGLHSQVAPVAAAFAEESGGRRLAYVMTDGAALPLALSDAVADLRTAGLLAGTVTAGHAFGGDHEAVTLPSALLVARHVLAADAAVVAMGPGVVGTATRFGFTATEVGAALDATDLLGGVPVAALRVSTADPRLRHQGVSHHTRTTLSALTRARALLAMPDGPFADRIRSDLEADGLTDRHQLHRVPVPDVPALLAGHGIEISSMGRSADDDPVFWMAAAAAGVLAARRLR